MNGLGGLGGSSVANKADQETASVKDESIDESVDEQMVQYTSHPIASLSLGPRFRFDKAVLKLTASEAKEFDKLLESQPAIIRARVRKLDLAAADEIAKQHISSQAFTGVDTTANGPQSPTPDVV